MCPILAHNNCLSLKKKSTITGPYLFILVCYIITKCLLIPPLNGPSLTTPDNVTLCPCACSFLLPSHHPKHASSFPSSHHFTLLHLGAFLQVPSLHHDTTAIKTSIRLNLQCNLEYYVYEALPLPMCPPSPWTVLKLLNGSFTLTFSTCVLLKKKKERSFLTPSSMYVVFC